MCGTHIIGLHYISLAQCCSRGWLDLFSWTTLTKEYKPDALKQQIGAYLSPVPDTSLKSRCLGDWLLIEDSEEESVLCTSPFQWSLETLAFLIVNTSLQSPPLLSSEIFLNFHLFVCLFSIYKHTNDSRFRAIALQLRGVFLLLTNSRARTRVSSSL